MGKIFKKIFGIVDENEEVVANTKLNVTIFAIIVVGGLIIAMPLLYMRLVFPVTHTSGESMMPNLMNDSYVILDNRKSTLNSLQKGDIISFQPAQLSEHYMKRIVAIEGDQVQIKSGKLFVNEVEIEESYLYQNMTWGFGGDEQVITVPQGCYFVLGDNRNHSTDSRSELVGMPCEGDIYGKYITPSWADFWIFVENNIF